MSNKCVCLFCQEGTLLFEGDGYYCDTCGITSPGHPQGYAVGWNNGSDFLEWVSDEIFISTEAAIATLDEGLVVFQVNPTPDGWAQGEMIVAEFQPPHDHCIYCGADNGPVDKATNRGALRNGHDCCHCQSN